MEYLTEEIIKKILVDSGESEDVEKIISCTGEPAVGPSENYCSNISRIYLQVKLKSGKTFSKTLVIKAFLADLTQDTHKEMKKLFYNEATMYSDILAPLGKLAKNHGFNTSILWPNYYSANTDFVVFDDLKEDGFIVPPRQDGLKIEDALQVVKYLGRFHALSLVGAKRKVIKPGLLRDTNTWAELGTITSRLVQEIANQVGGIIMEWGQEWNEPGRKIKDLSNELSQILNDLNKEDVPLKVINHGDLWITNIMIKYNQQLNFQSLRFVDFQNSTYNSIGWDLIYFLFSSIKAELMRSNYDRLLTSYRDEFLDTLQRLGENPSSAPTMDDIKSDIIRLHPFCLFIACSLNATVFNTSKQHVGIDEILSNPDKLRTFYTNQNWESSMKHNIKYFQQQNVL